MIKSCRECAHWFCVIESFPEGELMFGECRRYPPTTKPDSLLLEKSLNQNGSSQWEVLTHWEDYCGEWEQDK
jgi:hypothetical protein